MEEYIKNKYRNYSFTYRACKKCGINQGYFVYCSECYNTLYCNECNTYKTRKDFYSIESNVCKLCDNNDMRYCKGCLKHKPHNKFKGFHSDYCKLCENRVL